MRNGLIALLLVAGHAFAQPRIDSISPSQGPISGGTVVTISGANFTGANVTLDGGAITPQSQTDSSIALKMPAHDNGYGIVSVGGSYARFLYLPPRLQDLPAGYITTVGGIGAYGGEYGPATSAWFSLIWGMAFDASGRLYFADTNNGRIMRVRSDGIVEPFVTGLHFPRYLAFDSHGNLIVPDDQCYLFRVDPSGARETIAGTGHCATSAADGVTANTAAIGMPTSLALDASDNVYFVDWPTAVVHKIDGNGLLTVIAGSGTYGFGGDGGPATSAQFNEPSNDYGILALDHAGNVLLVDKGNDRVRRINKASGTIETIIGPAVNGHTLDNLRSIAVDANDNVYFSNAAGINRRAPDGTITSIASGKRGFSPDGALIGNASIGIVYAMTVDPAGNLLYADSDVPRARRIDRVTGQISTLAGSGPQVFGEGGPAVAATAASSGLAVLPTGELAFSGFSGLFKIDSSGRLIRIAGSGVAGPLFDVPALAATVGAASIAVTRDGTIDFAGNWVARIGTDGIVRHTAGSPGVCGFSGDNGDALSSVLCQSWDAVRDSAGNLYIADTNNNRIRRIDATTNVITTFAGSGAVNGFERYGAGTSTGDGGPATSATINTPYGIAFDDSGNLLICEAFIRRVDTTGNISRLAEQRCTKIAFAFGNVFTVASNHIARITRSGLVTSLTAIGDGFSGDGGPASAAHIKSHLQGCGIAIDAEGNLFFGDVNNLRIRAIRFGAVLAPPNATITATASGSTIRATVLDAGGRPAEGVRVDFSAPSSGASCSAPFGITDANGVATTACTPNCVAGPYSVVARPLAASVTATVTLSNDGRCHHRAASH